MAAGGPCNEASGARRIDRGPSLETPASASALAPGPTPPHRRIESIDALRGFALGGILLANIAFFTQPIESTMRGFEPALGAEGVLDRLIVVLVQGKFWILFSALFGIGFSLALDRLNERGARRLLLRRLTWLGVFGIAHCLLLWSGDVLFAYALAGFALYWIERNRRSGGGAASVAVGLSFYVGGVGFIFALTALAAFLPAPGDIAAETSAAIAEATERLAHGSFVDATGQRLADFGLQLSMLPYVLPLTIGIFVLGVHAARSGLLQRLATDPQRAGRLSALLLAISLPLGWWAMTLQIGVPAYAPTLPMAVGSTVTTLLGPVTSAGYALGLFALIAQWPAVGRALAPAGRMALTNYLLQSVVFSTFFLGYGFAQWGHWDRFGQIGLALGFFAMQLLASAWWLKRFRFGPMEWLWRRLTYGRGVTQRSVSP